MGDGMRDSTQNKPAILYKITNEINGKRYIGITCKTLGQRFASHVWSARNRPQANSAFHRAIVKYGVSVFHKEIVSAFEVYADAIEAERRYISDNAPEYNCTAGGDGALGYRHTEEAKAVMAAHKRGKPSHMKGKTHSNETKKLLSDKLKGKPGYWKGKRLPEHVVAAQRSGQAEWAKDKDRVREAMRPAHEAASRRVVCLDDGLEFASLAAAAAHYGIEGSSISEACRRGGARKRAGGLVFRYFGDHLGGVEEAQAVHAQVLASRQRTAGVARAEIARPVVCVDDGRAFDSVKSAAQFYGASPSRVRSVCSRQTQAPFYAHRAAGRIFRYAEDVDGL